MTRIVLEGPDHSGKTTLAKYLCDVTGARYYHPGGAPSDVQVERAFLIEQQKLVETAGPIVMDRVTSISQQVYNADDLMDPERIRHFELLTEPQFVFVVYCRPPNEHLADVANYTWRPEETEEHRQKIVERAFEWVQRYDRIMARRPCLHYDFKDASAAEALRIRLIGALTENAITMEWLNALQRRGTGR